MDMLEKTEMNLKNSPLVTINKKTFIFSFFFFNNQNTAALIDNRSNIACFILIIQSPIFKEACKKYFNNKNFVISDLNECRFKRISKCDQICENTPGSYKCTCREGFMMQFDGKTCIGRVTLLIVIH